MSAQFFPTVNIEPRSAIDNETMLELRERVREERVYLDKLHEMLSMPKSNRGANDGRY